MEEEEEKSRWYHVWHGLRLVCDDTHAKQIW